MKKGMFPTAEHLAHIAKFYASVAVACALCVIVIAFVVGEPLLLPVALIGFVCGRYQQQLLAAATAYWRNLCNQHEMSNGAP